MPQFSRSSIVMLYRNVIFSTSSRIIGSTTVLTCKLQHTTLSKKVKGPTQPHNDRWSQLVDWIFDRFFFPYGVTFLTSSLSIFSSDSWQVLVSWKIVRIGEVRKDLSVIILYLWVCRFVVVRHRKPKCCLPVCEVNRTEHYQMSCPHPTYWRWPFRGHLKVRYYISLVCHFVCVCLEKQGEIRGLKMSP